MRTILFAVLLFAASAHADVFLLRHAETTRGDSADPALSQLGIERAKGVAARLTELSPTQVFSTDYARTRGTAKTIADAAGVDVSLYDPRAPGELVEMLLKADGHQVVVGHSNTVPALVSALGGEAGPDIDHSEYDRLYRLTLTADGIKTSLLRSAPVHERHRPQPFPVDAARIRDETLVFAMTHDGKPAGTSSWRYQRDGGRIEMEEQTQLDEHNTDATIRIATDDDLGSGTMSMDGTMFGKNAKISVSWKGNRVEGSSLMPRAAYKTQGEISLYGSWRAGTMERSAALMLAHAVTPPAAARAFRWLNTYDGQRHHIELENIGIETVSVPAGTFETYKLRYRGGAPSQIFYVTTEAPYRTVRIDVIAMPWRYELLRVEEKNTD